MTEHEAFASLAEPNEHTVAWRRRKVEARRYIAAVGEAALFESLARRLDLVFQEHRRLPDDEELQAIVAGLLSDLGVSDGAKSARIAEDELTTAVVSGAAAQFLVCVEPSLERLDAVASIERYLDTDLVAQRVAGSGMSAAWQTMLGKVRFDVTSINDDEYQASDELERWQKELPRAVPSWRHGDFPHRGLSVQTMVSALVRAFGDTEWLRFLDRLPIPAIVEALLWAADVQSSPGVILDWIRAAPLVFDESGKRTGSALVFILERQAYDVIERHLMRSGPSGMEDEAPGDALSRVALPLAELSTTIGARSDGSVLLIELGAHYLVRGQAGSAESARTSLRHGLYCAVGASYARAVGSAGKLLTLARDRATADSSRSNWGLWLIAAVHASENLETLPGESNTMLRGCWSWLVEVLNAGDTEIAERHSPFAQWTERLAGMTLAAQESPLNELEATWLALAAQRLQPRENKYEKDSWATTRFLIRAAFFCSRLEQSPQTVTGVWSAGMEMALAAWFSRSIPNPFAEVAYGLAHLAAGKLGVAGEPTRTFEYLVGETDEVTQAVLVLLDNGYDPQRLSAAAAAASISATGYLTLNQNRQREAAVAAAVAQLRPREVPEAPLPGAAT